MACDGRGYCNPLLPQRRPRPRSGGHGVLNVVCLVYLLHPHRWHVLYEERSLRVTPGMMPDVLGLLEPTPWPLPCQRRPAQSRLHALGR